MIHLGGKYYANILIIRILYNTFLLNELIIEIGIQGKLVEIIKMCLNETYRTIRIGKYLSDKFSIQNCLKQKRCFITIAFQLWFGHMDRTHQPLASADDVKTVTENVATIQKNTEAALYASKEVGVKVNPQKLSIC
jgi:hypothetical protein